MSLNCSLKIREIELYSGAVICEHKDNTWHTLYYKTDTLKDLCVNHYIKQYIYKDKTDLNDLPNWQLFCEGKYEEELNFMMLLCKENVGN